MKKKTTVTKSVVWIVLIDGQYQGTAYSFFAAAESVAIDFKNKEETAEIKILEVVKAWEVYYPEEPDPEVIGLSLNEL